MTDTSFHINFKEAVAFAGTQAELARLLNVTDSAVTQWKSAGFLPEGSSYKLAAIAPQRFSPPNRVTEKAA